MKNDADLAVQAALAVLPVILGKAQAVTACDDPTIDQSVELAIAVGRKFSDAVTSKSSRRKRR